MTFYFRKYYALLPLLLLCLFFMWRAIDFPVHDFANYYFGGKFMAEGSFNSSIYFPYQFNKSIADLGFRHIFASYAPNTPFLAWLFVPFSFLPMVVAKSVFNLISIALFMFSVGRLVSFYKIESIFVWLLPVLFFIPIKNELLFGQVYLLLFFLIAESWLAYEKRQMVKMSAFAALAIFIKLFPILLVFVFIFKKQFRPLQYVLIAAAMLLLVSILCTGADVWIFYFKTILPKASNGEISEAFVSSYQSVFMFLKQLLVADQDVNPNAVLNVPNVFLALLLAFKIAILAIGFYLTRKASNSLFVISYWIFAMVLISPYGSTYTFILFLLPYFSLVKSPLSIPKKIIGCSLFFLIANLPVQVYENNVFPFSYIRLFALLILFALFLSWLFYTINLKIVSIAVAAGFIIASIGIKSEPRNSSYLIGKNGPVLVFDYKVSGGVLAYQYWNEAGKNSKSIPFEYAKITAATVQQNQIFSDGRQLTFEKSHKAKPLIVDGKWLVYLSDFDRGIGFYTLRKMKIH